MPIAFTNLWSDADGKDATSGQPAPYPREESQVTGMREVALAWNPSGYDLDESGAVL